jgi:hypothetical protein
MTGLLGFAALIAVVVWLIGIGRRPRAGLRSMPAPEDDVKTPIDHAALEEAERELNDPRARPLYEGIDEDDDDWGPGTR